MRLVTVIPFFALLAAEVIGGLIGGTAALADLAPYTVENAASVPAPLGGIVGDAERGPEVFVQMECGGCHMISGHAALGGDGGSNIGPDLGGIGSRLTPGEIRLMLIDPRITYPETDMPAYYAVGIYGEAPDDLVGRTRLTADEVEALVVWLSTLTQARDEGAAGGD